MSESGNRCLIGKVATSTSSVCIPTGYGTSCRFCFMVLIIMSESDDCFNYLVTARTYLFFASCRCTSCRSCNSPIAVRVSVSFCIDFYVGNKQLAVEFTEFNDKSCKYGLVGFGQSVIECVPFSVVIRIEHIVMRIVGFENLHYHICLVCSSADDCFRKPLGSRIYQFISERKTDYIGIVIINTIRFGVTGKRSLCYKSRFRFFNVGFRMEIISRLFLDGI